MKEENCLESNGLGHWLDGVGEDGAEDDTTKFEKSWFTGREWVPLQSYSFVNRFREMF